jgi:hypothetical protein
LVMLLLPSRFSPGRCTRWRKLRKVQTRLAFWQSEEMIYNCGGVIQVEDIWEQNAVKNFWKEGWSSRGWRKFHNEEPPNMCLPDTVRLLINSKRVRSSGHERDEKCIYNFSRKFKGNEPLWRHRLTTKVILKLIFINGVGISPSV